MARWFVDRLPQRGIPSVSLRRLLPEAQFVGCADWEVSGCCDDHRRLDPGQVFVAVRGVRPGYDGHAFVREALDRGAAGVVVEHPCPDAGRLQVVVPDAMSAHARICQALAGDPSHHLHTTGVTGSFGRTLTALLARSIFEAAGQRTGLLGALGFFDGTTAHPLGAGLDGRTAAGGAGQGAGGGASAVTATGPGRILGIGPGQPELTRTRLDRPPGAFAPGAASLAALLSEMVERGCKASVLEVSNEALLQRSFEGIAFHAAIATDVGAPRGFPDEVLLQRRRAKARLFRQVVPGGVAVVNADDRNAEILGGVNLDARRVAFAMEPVSRPGLAVDISARIVGFDGSGTRMVLHGFDRDLQVGLRLVGPRAAACAVAAAALAWALEIDSDAVVAGLEQVPPVAGHLESVDEGQDFDVRVDTASTPDALADALAAMRAVGAGRVHCVLGAEGGSDRAERTRLAEAAEAGADRVILTVNNPRSEDPNRILDQLLAGFRRPGKVRVEPDRRQAIEDALADARSGDSVLIAGKGRHTYQILADRVVPFDDAEVAREWLRHHARSRKSTQRSA
jgi:UDP-N-acetylmuramoyl-L-alanyl-D-glutamate--2,6-diaminopimelate ligase